ncbi:MAG: type I DNA topoisomerase [Pseudomonadota bacterium]
MAKALIVVESPAKAKTIEKYLGKGFSVEASVGHIKDLPKSKLGVDIENGFAPEYVVIRGKRKVINEIKKACKGVDRVYLGPDPDREGEAIAWHIADEIRGVCPQIHRVLFTEITRNGVTRAIQNPTDLDLHKYEAQQARRILDRLVGYQISPILWKKVKSGLSAGRVQSVALRLVVIREREIRAFVPTEYWTISCDVQTEQGQDFEVKLTHVSGKKAELSNGEEANSVVERLNQATYNIETVTCKERKRRPLPPFITSKLQQEAASKLRFSAKRTMVLAQRLYEGIELGEEGAVGLITYMRTDSTRLSGEAVEAVRTLIGERYGADYLPEEPIFYRSRKGAQDAHEAIRPTDMRFDPDTVRNLLSKTRPKSGKVKEVQDLIRLYTLIWNRFVACQMNPAVYDQTTVDVKAGDCSLRATGQILRFDGYRAVYQESVEDSNGSKEKDRLLPEVKEGESLALKQVRPEQHFTQPPPRFTEAGLVKELEEKGIGRPSTYANILSTIQDREYAEKRDGRFHPTELGELINDLLCESFPSIVNVEFTANMEESLDKVEEGNEDWVALLSRFYEHFSEVVERAKVEMRDVRREEIPTEHNCEKCGSTMIIKWGRNGKFLACSGYPDCKNTKDFNRTEDGSIEIVKEEVSDEVCEKCGAQLVVKHGRFGSFLACSRFPECKTTRAISVGVDCPVEGCGGFVTEKRSRRGKVFYGCSNYAKTKCGFVSWDPPVLIPCPQCKNKFLMKHRTQKGVRIYCFDKDCGYSQNFADESEIPDEKQQSGMSG